MELSRQAENSEPLDAAVFQEVCSLADQASQAQAKLSITDGRTRRELLELLADALVQGADSIAQANREDEDRAFAAGMDRGLLDRLHCDQERVVASAQAVRSVAAQPDPLGQVAQGHRMPNGMDLVQVRVALGVVAVIYEARPNVTVDVAALSLMAGNAVLLRGGHAASLTNQVLVSIMRDTLASQGFSQNLVSSVDQFGRQGARALMEATGHIDLLVPRGGKALIENVVQHSRVPTIETGAGNVHIYVDSSADMDAAIPIIVNAKTQRVGVCNAAEKLLVHRQLAPEFLPKIARALTQAQVELHLDTVSRDLLEAGQADPSQALPEALLKEAGEQDWDEEYLSLRMGVRVVDSLDQAIEHIRVHSSGHTEAIIAQDYQAIERFTRLVDSAVIMVNASTRFTDGGLFGMGAELGISTQKLHARGPMGLQALTTTKWISYGTGQVRL